MKLILVRHGKTGDNFGRDTYLGIDGGNWETLKLNCLENLE